MKANQVGAAVLSLCMAVAAHAQEVRPVPMTKYADAADGVSLEYPSVWKRVTGSDDYCPSAVVRDQGPVPVTFAVEFTGKGNYYAKTGLESLVFLFGTKKNISQEACTQLARKFAGVVTSTTPEGVDPRYDYGRGGECGLNHVLDAQVYTRFTGDRCYVFEEDFGHYNGAPEGKRDLTVAEKQALQRHLDGIMQSVKIQSTMLPKSWATATYRDAGTGVSFQYPAAFRETRDVGSYFPAALLQRKGLTFHAKLAYSPPRVPKVEEATTDLGWLAFLFATKPTTSRKACYALAEELSESGDSWAKQADVTFGDATFHVEDISNAGLSHFTNSSLYATYRAGTCFLFEQVRSGLDGYAGDMTDEQWAEVRAHMAEIAPTIRFGAAAK